jgi:uncharacterized protein with HEPN domain
MRRDEQPLTDRQRMGHMLAAGRDAVTISAGRARADLDTDVQLRHALTHCVAIIGEAAAGVSEAGRGLAPALPWPRIVGMRHILVHAYYKVDLDALWRVVTEHVQAMIPLLEAAAWDDPDTQGAARP